MRSFKFLTIIGLLLLTYGISHAQKDPAPEEKVQEEQPQKEQLQEELPEEDQPQDEPLMLQPGMDTTGMNLQIDSIYIDEEILDRPKKAGFYSAVLPGLGQAYNKRYWKIPVIYGAFGTIGYFIGWNNNKYQQYRNAYLLKKSFPFDELDDPLAINISEDNLKRGIDYYRRNRDLLMIVLVGVYLLQVLDAHIDAHLMEFDVSEDLTFRLEPAIEQRSLWASQQYGIKLTLNLN
jgi:hypothetical protein